MVSGAAVAGGGCGGPCADKAALDVSPIKHESSHLGSAVNDKTDKLNSMQAQIAECRSDLKYIEEKSKEYEKLLAEIKILRSNAETARSLEEKIEATKTAIDEIEDSADDVNNNLYPQINRLKDQRTDVLDKAMHYQNQAGRLTTQMLELLRKPKHYINVQKIYGDLTETYRNILG